MADVNLLAPEWMQRFTARYLPNGPDNRLASPTGQSVGPQDGAPFDPIVGRDQFTGRLQTASQAAEQARRAELATTLAMGFVGGNGLAAQDARAFSQKVGYNPPVVPQRPVALDYPNGVPVDASGRILATPEGVPLTAQSVVGRRELLPSGVAPDIGLDPASVNAVGTQAGGARYLVRAAALPRKSVGRFIPDWDPVTGERAARIEISNRLNPSATATVAAHETAHLIDWVAGKIPTAGIVNDLNKIHVALNDVKPGAMGYSPAEVPGELMAEAIRAYKNNPNWLKTVAPKVASRIREYVNNNPQLNRFIQFNSVAGLAAPVAANALSESGQNSEVQ